MADGYGANLVLRFHRTGNYIGSLSGEEGAGRFSCPHSVYIHIRKRKEPELYIADRSDQRVQIYDLEGGFLRSFGEGYLNSPRGFAQWGKHLVVAALYGRLAALDPNDRLVGYLAEDVDCHAKGGWPSRPGWPNMISDAEQAPAPHPHPDRVNSLHALAVNADGNLLVSEWLIGGRYDKLHPR